MSCGFEFKAEIAASGRAKCKACKAALPKDEVRLGVRQVTDPAKDMDDQRRAMAEAVHWFHPVLKCFGTYRKTPKWWAENAPSPDEVVGLEELDEEDQEKISQIIEDLKEGRVATSKAKAKAKGKAKASASKQQQSAKGKRGTPTKAAASESEEEESGTQESGADESEEEDATRKAKNDGKANNSKKRSRQQSPPQSSSAGSDEESKDESEEDSPKRRKTTTGRKTKGKASPKSKASNDFEYEAASLSDEKVEEIREKGSLLLKKTNAQLKEMLKTNRQILSGVKEELICRVAEGQVLGALPKCPECGGGILRWNSNTGKYNCPGFHDDGEMKRCPWKGEEDDVERVDWISA